MERSAQAKGWHGMRFDITRFDPNNQTILDAPEESQKKDRCCSQEKCGHGCYVATVDFEKLDQQ